MTLREKQSKFAQMLGFLLVRARDLGTPVCILELYRSVEQEKKNIADGSSHLKDPMNCKHCQGLAVDLCFLADLTDDGILNYGGEKYRVLGEHFEWLGGRWGGRFGVNPTEYKTKIGWDCGHFEFGE